MRDIDDYRQRRSSQPAQGRPRPDPADDTSVAERPAAPVVAVMVAHDPGPWWDHCLASLAAQTYRDLTVLVLANQGAAHPTEIERRLRAALPRAVLRVLPTNAGFGPACNQVIGAVEGAAYFLFLHDDVVLDAIAVEALVDEALRSNAGIVGPKIVEWDDPRRLRQVGLSADKFGAPSSPVERGEIDQEQHDAVRDVFFVPGAATLVRADLFTTLGGFDPAIHLVGEDLDLCWRAHAAGARVVVAPRARVAHREALEERAGGSGIDRRRLTREHRLRTVLTCYGLVHRWRVLPQLFLLTVIEALASLVVWKVGRARAVLAAWPAALGQRRSLRRKRKALRAVRVVSDSEVRSMQVRGSAGANRFVRDQLDVATESVSVAGTVSRIGARARERSTEPLLLALGAVVIVALVGTRDLLFSIPAVGQLVPLDAGPIDLLQAWFAGGALPAPGTGPAPTALGFIGIIGAVLLGAMGLLRQLLVIGLLPLGAVGVWRLARPIGSARGRLVALVVYLALPLTANALAAGRWGALAAWALAPWTLAQLARASGLDPFAGAHPSRRAVAYRGVAAGLLTALAAMIEPWALAGTLLTGLSLALGAALAGERLAAVRIAQAGAAGTAVAFGLHLPWSGGLLFGGWADTTGTGAVAFPAIGLSEVLRFATGPVADSPLLWAVLLAAALPLLIARSWRLVWALGAWTLAVVGIALAWAGTQGWLDGLLPAPEVLLAPSAAALALAAALGVASLEVDLPDRNFGWAQLAAIAVAGASLVGVAPIVGASTDGRWGMPRGDFRQIIGRLESPSEDFRTLWIGDASVVPLRGWALDAPALAETDPGRQLVYSTTHGRLPTVVNLWPGTRGGPAGDLTTILGEAASSGTTRLGSRLAPLNIQFVIVPRRQAPVPYVNRDTTRPDALVDLLAGQLDLRRIDVVAGIHVYRNTAWSPPADGTTAGAAGQGQQASLVERALRFVQLGLWAAVLGFLIVRRPASERGEEDELHLDDPPPRDPDPLAPSPIGGRR